MSFKRLALAGLLVCGAVAWSNSISTAAGVPTRSWKEGKLICLSFKLPRPAQCLVRLRVAFWLNKGVLRGIVQQNIRFKYAGKSKVRYCVNSFTALAPPFRREAKGRVRRITWRPSVQCQPLQKR